MIDGDCSAKGVPPPAALPGQAGSFGRWPEQGEMDDVDSNADAGFLELTVSAVVRSPSGRNGR
ncbi:hypothetical protein [Streptomyces sp. NBC_00158]|uniref:hypothetical protein n=1 Tax=Streptomyces sp. NBC_00158 TaxID=2903627 RepID=UPI00386B7FBF